MKNIIKRKYQSIITISSLIAGITFSSFSSAELIIIVNPNQDIGAVSKSDIARVFLGKSKTLKGKGVTVINQVISSDSRKTFDDSILKKTPQQIKSYWSKQLFSGNGAPPKELAGDLDVLVFVAENKKAIGYIDSSALNPSVKKLTVD